MLGVLLAVANSAFAAMVGRTLLNRWSTNLDPAEKWGLAGLSGLGVYGLATLLLGLFPNGVFLATTFVPFVGVIVASYGFYKRYHGELRFSLPKSTELLALLVLLIVGLLALVAVLAPSISSDWDTIAYHLAVPKLWLAHGQIDYISGIHHSNFPSTMEMLFMWGLKFGGQSGAKAFSLVVYAFGCLSLFGLARRWYGGSAGWWAALAFAGIPVVAWESGTGYIDVAHGLFCALGALYAVEFLRKEGSRDALVLSGICLGFALGTKYTGLQMLFATVVVVVLATMFGFRPNARHARSDSSQSKDGGGKSETNRGTLGIGFREAVRAKLTIVLVALAVGGAWYVKTAVMTGNPVYPFFYSVLDGRDWDEWRAEIYTDEQKSFGVGSSLAGVGHAVLGLAYQPGRYTNPAPTQGQGFPTGAIGFACLLGGVCAATCGRLRREERALLAIVGLGFLMWFSLSQQSRYLTMLAIPLGVLAAGQVSRVKWGAVVAGGIAVQAVYSIWLINTTQTQLQLQVVGGKVSADQYLTELMSPFYPASKAMNALQSGSKVALYDEVFGFYLDVPYFWANPGHSTYIPYESMDDADGFTAALRERGFTHVYVNALVDPRFRAVLQGEAQYSDEDRTELWGDLNQRWRMLLVDAVAEGKLEQVRDFGGARLYRLVE